MSERAWRILERGLSALVVCVLGAFLVFGVLSLAGCAAGRGPGGEIVVGWDVAKLPETANQFASTLIDLALPGAGVAGAGILGVIGVALRASTARRRAEVAAAESEGRHTGWEERQDAATVQAPLVAVPVQPGGGVVAAAGVAPVVPQGA